MTRINCIEPFRLNRNTLISEYREMPRVRHYKPRRTNVNTYRLGTGHVLFFYDKGGYLVRRHKALRDEMHRRGYETNYKLDLAHWPAWAMNDWEPDVDAKLASVARIINRMVS